MPRRPLPLLLPLPRRVLERAQSVSLLVRHAWGQRATPRAFSAFRLKNDERPFALELLRRKPNLWLYRSNQFASCGDFFVVDMSSPAPELRRAWVLDLKLGAPLRRGGRGAGNQLARADEGARELIERFGVLGPEVSLRRLTGDRRLLLRELRGA